MIEQDLKLYATDDGAELEVLGDEIQTSTNLETAIYMSLFSTVWWGDNVGEKIETGKTLSALKNNAAIPASLRTVEQAVLKDLSWLSPTPTVEVSIPSRNTAKIEIAGKFSHVQVWGDQQPKAGSLPGVLFYAITNESTQPNTADYKGFWAITNEAT